MRSECLKISMALPRRRFSGEYAKWQILPGKRAAKSLSHCARTANRQLRGNQKNRIVFQIGKKSFDGVADDTRVRDIVIIDRRVERDPNQIAASCIRRVAGECQFPLRELAGNKVVQARLEERCAARLAISW